MSNALKHRTLSEAIAERLRDAILSGEHPAGAQLRQDALAESFGVSRIPLREALFQLEGEGLVRIVPHKGAVVAGLSMDEIDDVFDLRATLEKRLIEDSIPRLTAADFAPINRACAEFEVVVAAGEIARTGEINADLHLALYAAARRPKTLSIVAGLLRTSERYTRLQLASSKGMEKAASEHRELVALARERDVAGASKLLVAHIEAVRADLAKVLRRSPGLVAAFEGEATSARRRPTKSVW